MKIMQRMSLAVMVMVVLLVAQGCAVQSPTVTPAPENTAPPTQEEGMQTAQPAALTGRTWKWVLTQMNDGLELTPRQPDAFTIEFRADGSMSGTTDCNTFFGQYELRGSELTFGPIGSTRMFCENAQEGEFLRYLGEVGSYMIEEDTGRLVLMVKFDSGSIIFE